MSTRIKTLVGAAIAGAAIWTFVTEAAFAQQMNQSSPQAPQSDCSCCKKMKMGS